MDNVVLAILIISFLLYCYKFTEKLDYIYDYDYDPQYDMDYKTPKELGIDDERPKLQYLLNGVKYDTMENCVKGCKKYVSPGLKNHNYCINNYGEYVCYPSTW
jgi:hypothetical protein